MIVVAVKESADLLGVNWTAICSVTDPHCSSPPQRENCGPSRGGLCGVVALEVKNKTLEKGGKTLAMRGSGELRRDP